MTGKVYLKKSILIVHHSMDIGGVETSLLGLLNSIDYLQYQVDLMLLCPQGELLNLIPDQVNLLNTPLKYQYLALPIKRVLRQKNIVFVVLRLIARFLGSFYKDKAYSTKQILHKITCPLLPKIVGKYDLAISFIDPHYIVAKKVNAKVKMAWLHTDFSIIDCNFRRDNVMWKANDYIVSVSEKCKVAFDKKYPKLAYKSIVVENLLSRNYIETMKDAFSVQAEMPCGDSVKLLSIGRFCTAKNFDNVPDICKRLIEKNIKVKWYLIGYGGDEQLIKDKIAEAGMEENVILLGKKENPYPYIKACDIYVQPSRYEGKSVSVREAQILNKPVVITNYSTSASQLEDGVDGIIVPLHNEACAEGLARVICDKELQDKLIENTKSRDYTNSKEIEKIYKLIND